MKEIKFTRSQQDALNKIKQFLIGTGEVFILKGSAGTGKTTLIKYVLEYLKDEPTISPVLLASTGRAAKVLQEKSGNPATTVHSQIYTFSVLSDGSDNDQGEINNSGQLTLNFSLRTADSFTKYLYIIDEASMLSHLTLDNPSITRFGSGNLLKDLFTYAKGHKILFVGDPVQLPPVTELSTFSPALNAKFLSEYFAFNAQEFELTEVMRQDAGNVILNIAQEIRQFVQSNQYPP
jgi:ATP-dependent exoDNAse (exonuclease V) alpha subunit